MNWVEAFVNPSQFLNYLKSIFVTLQDLSEFYVQMKENNDIKVGVLLLNIHIKIYELVKNSYNSCNSTVK